MRFDEHEAIERSFEDAMAELRYDHYEDLGSRQSKSESDTADEEKSETIVNSDNFPEGTTGVSDHCTINFLVFGREDFTRC